jgi:hypothetical protein
MKKLQDKTFLTKLNENNEVSGYTSPTSGRITYNKVVSKRSFAAFTDIITSIVPLDVVNDPDNNHLLPSIANVLKKQKYADTIINKKYIYKQYLFLNATMDEYMDYEDEEDQENMTSLLESIDDLPLKTPMIGITIQKSEAMGSAHASAFIVWKHASKKQVYKFTYKFAYYDPLAHRKKTKSYDYAERAFIPSRFEQDIEFINLNEYCFRKEKDNHPSEFHCSQYIMNAEYCYMYSLYFLHKWLGFGAKLHRASFKKAIKSTYIVPPEKLTRENNKDSMIYRVVMMQFVCDTFLKYLKSLNKKNKKYILDSETNIKTIEQYLTEFKDTYGFDLLH